jgi:hypothetical protein
MTCLQTLIFERPKLSICSIKKTSRFDIINQVSLGIGARFTTMHWPAVDWVMKELRLPLTANQNSVPRELV